MIVVVVNALLLQSWLEDLVSGLEVWFSTHSKNAGLAAIICQIVEKCSMFRHLVRQLADSQMSHFAPPDARPIAIVTIEVVAGALLTRWCRRRSANLDNLP